MEVCFINKKVKINTKAFGKIEVVLDRKNKLGNGYIVDTIINGKNVSGYIDLNFKEIIDIDEKVLVEEFHTDSYQDICLGYKIKGEEQLEYYHISMINDNAKIVFLVGPYSDLKYAFVKTCNDNYWLLQTLNEDKEYAVYDIKQRKPITTFFDMIEFVEPEDNIYHTIFFQKTIKSDIVDTDTNEKDIIIHTNLCGFLDSYGNFSSEILDEEEEICYPAFNMGDNTFSPAYNNFIITIHKAYLEEYMNKQDRINKYISYLAEHPNVYNNSCKRKAKVIDFNSRKKV